MKTRLFISGLIILNIIIISGCKDAQPDTEKKDAQLNTEKESVQFDTEEKKFSYAAGAQFGKNISKQAIDIDVDMFLQGMRDTLTNAEPKLNDEEIQQALLAYREKAMKKQAEANNAHKLAGEEFLAQNKTKEGVNVTDSGLQYKIITQGEGKKPSATDEIVVHYRGTLIDGTEFDSSYARGEPITLQLNQVIQGWQEALPMMPTGSKWQIYVPAELGYGEHGAGSIPPGSALIFDIELIGIN